MLTLVIGGAGSGKSAFAEKLVCGLSGERIYLATMETESPESAERIAKHRKQRSGLGFRTVERCKHLAALQIPENGNVLLEDLSNLLANELFAPDGGGTEAVCRGLRSLSDQSAHLTVVTNEIFSDGTALTGETEHYVKELALLNRKLAGRADLVVEVVCGLPNLLKGDLPWMS